VLTTYADRPSAITAADCVERFERRSTNVRARSTPVGAGLIKTRERLRRLSQSGDHQRQAGDDGVGGISCRACVGLSAVRRSDPRRRPDRRNAAPHASFMPTRFEALTP